MGDGKLCPACGTDIGLRPIVVAGLPNRIFCPWCGARLRYRRTGLLLGVVLILAMASLGLIGLVEPPILAFVAWLAAWLLVELAIAGYLRHFKRLEPVRSGDRRRAPSDG